MSPKRTTFERHTGSILSVFSFFLPTLSIGLMMTMMMSSMMMTSSAVPSWDMEANVHGMLTTICEKSEWEVSEDVNTKREGVGMNIMQSMTLCCSSRRRYFGQKECIYFKTHLSFVVFKTIKHLNSTS